MSTLTVDKIYVAWKATVNRNATLMFHSVYVKDMVDKNVNSDSWQDFGYKPLTFKLQQEILKFNDIWVS